MITVGNNAQEIAAALLVRIDELERELDAIRNAHGKISKALQQGDIPEAVRKQLGSALALAEFHQRVASDFVAPQVSGEQVNK